jgi:hypothetical protein
MFKTIIAAAALLIAASPAHALEPMDSFCANPPPTLYWQTVCSHINPNIARPSPPPLIYAPPVEGALPNPNQPTNCSFWRNGRGMSCQ